MAICLDCGRNRSLHQLAMIRAACSSDGGFGRYDAEGERPPACPDCGQSDMVARMETAKGWHCLRCCRPAPAAPTKEERKAEARRSLNALKGVGPGGKLNTAYADGHYARHLEREYGMSLSELEAWATPTGEREALMGLRRASGCWCDGGTEHTAACMTARAALATPARGGEGKCYKCNGTGTVIYSDEIGGGYSDTCDRCYGITPALRSCGPADLRERLRAFVADDARAITYQTLGQYRAALLALLEEEC